MSTTPERIVVVGASLAGLRSAEALRTEGFDGRIVLVGDEDDAPYDRPALSKGVLAGRAAADRLGLPSTRSDLDAEWLLGAAATSLDARRRIVGLTDGRRVDYDALVVATGTRARPWPDPDQASLDGVVTVRTRADAVALRASLAVPDRRVLIIGAGFIGSEVASVARELGHAVTLVDRGHGPLTHALGRPAGALAIRVQRRAGVDVRTSTAVIGLDGADGRVTAARLSDGDRVEADVVVVALGAVRNVEWLAGSGLAADAAGVACDAACRALTEDGQVADRIVAAGDIVRRPHPLLGDEPVSVEHWQHAVDSAAVAAHSLVHGPDDEPGARSALPVFWSNQFGVNVKAVGLPSAADEVAVVQGSVADLRLVAAYGRAGRMIGAVAVDMPRSLDVYGALITARAPFPPQLNAPDAPSRIRAHPTAGPVDGSRAAVAAR